MKPFPWGSGCYQKLSEALRDQISDAATLECIWEDARIEPSATLSRGSFSIDNEYRQAIENCLNADERRNLNSTRGRAVRVLGYDKYGNEYELELKRNGDGLALEGRRWRNIMENNQWSEVTKICFWGFPYGGRNSGKPACFVFTYNI